MKPKQLIRQYRASKKRPLPPLIHLLINLKTRDIYAWKRLKPTLLDKSLEFEYGIKNKVVSCHRDKIFEPYQQRPFRGRKTYFDDKSNKFFSYDPSVNAFPF